MHEKYRRKRLSQLRTMHLFAGAGGGLLADLILGHTPVVAVEWDKYACSVLRERAADGWFPGLQVWEGDVRLFDPSEYAGGVDLIHAGFPCQPFSQAGFKKGFADIRGTLFFDIAEIIRVKKPKAFFLENVRGLYSHDEGRTFETIKKTLTEDLGYSFHHAIVKASDHGLPQHRPRLFMVGFRDSNTEFEFPAKRNLKFTMSDVMKGEVDREIGFTLRVGGKRSPIDDRRNWDGYIVDGEVRRLSPSEGKKMQGFPASFKFPVSDSEALKQLGNSVAVTAIQDYAAAILNSLGKRNGAKRSA
jgi:DNA (cytosine-5)-methyltransferase 1